MPTWSEILKEFDASISPPDFNGFRRGYMRQLHQHTGRDVILYATAWTQTHKDTPASALAIDDEDIHSFMEVNADLDSGKLDLILHSPGGSPEAAEAIVTYLRSRFSHIRVIVPNLAMSAATMIACAADEIVLGKHSFLGPTDPQIVISTPYGSRLAPAQAILDQFDKARRDSADPAKFAVWVPMLNQYAPDLLVRCETALELSKDLVREWLRKYMLSGVSATKAESISTWLSSHNHFKSHARHIPRDELAAQGLNIRPLEADQTLQDLALSVFHATILAFTRTNTVKIVESHTGRALVYQDTQAP